MKRIKLKRGDLVRITRFPVYTTTNYWKENFAWASYINNIYMVKSPGWKDGKSNIKNMELFLFSNNTFIPDCFLEKIN